MDKDKRIEELTGRVDELIARHLYKDKKISEMIEKRLEENKRYRSTIALALKELVYSRDIFETYKENCMLMSEVSNIAHNHLIDMVPNINIIREALKREILEGDN